MPSRVSLPVIRAQVARPPPPAPSTLATPRVRSSLPPHCHSRASADRDAATATPAAIATTRAVLEKAMTPPEFYLFPGNRPGLYARFTGISLAEAYAYPVGSIHGFRSC